MMNRPAGSDWFGVRPQLGRQPVLWIGLAVLCTTGCQAQPADPIGSRDTIRAYYGAPPVIPHAVRDLGRANCLACHADGLKPADGPPAVPKPHATLGECVQCHVEQHRDVKLVAENHFVGLAEPRIAVAAYPGAPFLIPHKVWQRENCLACHGPHGHESMRTRHPERTNCIQCHVPQLDVPLIVENEFSGNLRNKQ